MWEEPGDEQSVGEKVSLEKFRKMGSRPHHGIKKKGSQKKGLKTPLEGTYKSLEGGKLSLKEPSVIS